MAMQLQTRAIQGPCAARAAAPAPGLRAPFAPALRPLRAPRQSAPAGRRVAVAAQSQDVDFDKVLEDIANKFEKSDNKVAVVGYSVAAVIALWFSEWLIHLPLFNFLLGAPIQLLGLLLLPYLSVKYLVDGESAVDDAGRAFDRVVKKLPGFDK